MPSPQMSTNVQNDDFNGPKYRLTFPGGWPRVSLGMAKLIKDTEFDTSSLKPAQMRRIRSLATMSEEQLARFLPFVRFVRCGQHDVVCREGEDARSMFLILQ